VKVNESIFLFNDVSQISRSRKEPFTTYDNHYTYAFKLTTVPYSNIKQP